MLRQQEQAPLRPTLLKHSKALTGVPHPMLQAMYALHPCLEALSLEPSHLLGVGIQELSVSQIEGLEEVLAVMARRCEQARQAALQRAQAGDGPGFLVHDVPDVV